MLPAGMLEARSRGAHLVPSLLVKRALFSMAVASSVAACALFVGDINPTLYEGGDGGAPHADGDTHPTGPDTGIPNHHDAREAAANGDGGTDANSDADIHFCGRNGAAPSVVFCDDFDQPGRVEAGVGATGWTSYSQLQEGVVESAVAASPPNAALLTYNVDGAASRAIATRTFPFPAGKTRFRFQAEVRVNQGYSNDYPVMSLGLNGGCMAELFVSTGVYVYCPTGGTSGPAVTAVGFQAWTPVEIDLVRGLDGTDSFMITVSGVSGSVALMAVDGGIDDQSVVIALGESGGNYIGSVYYDDVLASIE